jgi:hypothetical protein
MAETSGDHDKDPYTGFNEYSHAYDIEVDQSKDFIYFQ